LRQQLKRLENRTHRDDSRLTMKSQLIAIVAAVLVVGCGPSVDIHEAAKSGNIKAVKQHLAAGADVDAKHKYGLTPLHRAAFSGHKEIAELLIANGADVNAKGELGETPLHDATQAGQKEIIELLIAKGADVNAKGVDGSTPLHVSAVMKGRKETAELLIAKGADVNAKDKDGTTPLDRAIKDKKISDLLRNHGGKYSSIHIPSVAGNVEAVTEFLSNGADVNAKTKLGQTPLHMAALAGHKDVVELLISKGADVNALTVSDPFKGEDVPAFAASAIKEKTPLDLALLLPETADLLRKHGGKTGEELKAEGK